jgi:hypothetical protein
MKTALLFILYRIFESLEPAFESISEWCGGIRYYFERLHWHSKMPHNVRIGSMGLPNYYCPFCNHDLDYRINFDGISSGVCWDCNKAWLETWCNSDAPDFDNCEWPTKYNVLVDPPSVFWEETLYHWFITIDGLMVDQGKVDSP